MLIISMRDDENNRWKKNKKQANTQKNKGGKTIVEGERVKANSCAFKLKLGFFQMICKPALIFKLNEELALSNEYLVWKSK